jgi:molecular chaperone HscC
VENQALISRADRVYEEARGDLRFLIKQSIMQFEAEIKNQQLRKPEKLRESFALQLDEFESHISHLD